MQRLILIGYWRSESDPRWPDPSAFVDGDWDKTERGLVASYLSAATVVATYMGYSRCRLCSKKDNGDSELTDGVYVWPDGLKHYVTEHCVRLPRRFVEHVLDRLASFDLGFRTTTRCGGRRSSREIDMSVFKVFARCNGGHYFAGSRCPFDGWSSEETEAIAAAAERFVDEGKNPSMTALEASHLTRKALARACVIEFYSVAHAVDAIQPELVVIGGRVYKLNDAPQGIK